MKAFKGPSLNNGEVMTNLSFVNLLKHENECSRSRLLQKSYDLSFETIEKNISTSDPNGKNIAEENIAGSGPMVNWLSTFEKPIFDSEADSDEYRTADAHIANFKDVENNKHNLEEKLLNIQKMEAIGTLAGGIAHDFNNILMGIQGYISMILYDLKPDHPYRIKFENIENYLKRGADLTKQLLNFAQGGKYEVKATDINELLDKSVNMFGRTKKEICIYKSFKDGLWTVDVDGNQIDQVFLNLFINASQAMPGGGNLQVETDNVELGENNLKAFNIAGGRYIKITVTDDGIGMDRKTMKRIFEPFFTTKPKGVGTGLGLTSSYGIIKNHGGAIQVNSEPGKGTTFEIYLPATNNVPVVGREHEETIITGTETILIVDDEQINVSVMKEMLEMLHYRVLCAGSGQEAIAVYMEKHKYIDMVILDMILPGMSGSQTFDILRQINPHIPVILASGYNAKGEAQKIMDNGCNGFIQKPFHLQDLSKKIREVLDSQSAKAHH